MTLVRNQTWSVVFGDVISSHSIVYPQLLPKRLWKKMIIFVLDANVIALSR